MLLVLYIIMISADLVFILYNLRNFKMSRHAEKAKVADDMEWIVYDGSRDLI